MIEPKKNTLIASFFHRYILRIVKKNFQAVNFNQVNINADKSVLLLPNHYSWWDGFLIYYLNAVYLKKKFHVMILEQTGKKFFFMKYLGAYTVNKGSKDVITSLEYTAKLLQDPQNLVLIFPQGTLYSNFTDDIKFQNGLSRVIKQAAGAFQTLFAVSFMETLQYKKPLVNINLQLHADHVMDMETLKKSFQEYYSQCKLAQGKIVV
ncbi:1-acyl-sn-glycerol-3-phosphate acyltransferase [Mucilaginibacter sp. KACC 22063]|uniref:1-acyl-sn-glycerol-3-phosphate acyltransferase n=1 Tax=Mucilaginibacter sp. KACC 22063 TaxID=3025666 RepID=UPI0023666314|nr:1-acyl-sn-glycerol-3-phosphate acyltransferase [Mucilaginibacter sp. KACC 22063]WDF56311.1 1-acyl-sn-glycerol-3-phosphate acyltransferase [Mucilaginibacter sp. KACC 22063]